MGIITVNGKTYEGNSVTVSNGTVIIDGKVQHDESSPQITISVDGDIKSLDVDTGKVSVNGNVGGIAVDCGDIECKDVVGHIKVDTGNVSCGNVGGSVSTNIGNIVTK